jgi:hypothetical protein
MGIFFEMIIVSFRKMLYLCAQCLNNLKIIRIFVLVFVDSTKKRIIFATKIITWKK